MFGKKSSDIPSETSALPKAHTLPVSGSAASGTTITPSFAQARVSAAVAQSAPTKRSASAVAMSEDMARLMGLDLGTERISYIDTKLETPDFKQARRMMLSELVDKIDVGALERLELDVKRRRVREYCDSVLPSIPIPLTSSQIQMMREQAVNELLGFGPIEILLNDTDVADILINTHAQVYIERQGKLYLTDVTFIDEQHLLGIIQRIVSRVGRRVDEANPMVDARMPDGSRFNAIIPPLALDGCLVSIRKFKATKMPLTRYIDYGSMNEAMCRFLSIAANIRLNMIISGGTGSGKTTLLNALSEHIDPGERIVTIEDAAELRLLKPHVLRLETRPPSIEGRGEISQRLLVKNALRMRPDRIILGEIRGDEVVDVLTAMNTGHDGSMATIHSNSPRDALSRIENLMAMSSVQVTQASVRYQIASAINLIIQIQRMRDGVRRITNIDEIAGTESGNILMQPIFSFKVSGVGSDGMLQGEYICHTMRPYLTSRAELFGREKELLECFKTAL